ERRVLGDGVRVDRVAIDPNCARVHEVPDALGPCGVEEDSRAADVHVLGADRVLHDLVDVGDGGEVKHSVAAAYRGADGGLVAEVADRCVDRVAVAVVRGGEEV